jgi:type IV secretory pathway TrbL component
MMRATGAKLRMLASEVVALLLLLLLLLLWIVLLGDVCGGEVEECGDEDDMALAAGRAAGAAAATATAQVQNGSDWLGTATERGGSTQRWLRRAIGGYVGI